MASVLDGIEKAATPRALSDRVLLGRMWSYLRAHTVTVLGIAAAVVVAAGADTALPVYISRSLDDLRSGTAEPLLVAAVLASVGVLAWVLNYVRARVTMKAVSQIVIGLHADVFTAILRQGLTFHDEASTAQLADQVKVDILGVARVVSLAVEFISQLTLIVLLIGCLIVIDWRLTALTLGLAPIIIATALGFRRIARRAVGQARQVQVELAGHVQEAISGIAVAKAFRQEQLLFERFLGVSQQLFVAGRRVGYAFAAILPTLGILGGAGRAALAYWGGSRVVGGTLSVGDWYLFLQAMQLYWLPLTNIAFFWSQFQHGLSSAERVFALLEPKAQIAQTGVTALARIRGEIEFDGVEFAYKAGDPVLRKLSLKIAAGETVAIVGHTGAGKSSIARLIARLYEFQGGFIRVDGHDIRSLALPDYQSRIGIVTQTPFLFDGTVLENIRYGRLDAMNSEVREAAQLVAGGDWLRSLPDGLETRVGERGGNLSMGQRQLVSMARVILQNPAIFILDEATASIDPLTEAHIQEGLRTVTSARTSVVIAHRLATVRSAHRIVVVRNGEVVEEGTHANLLAAGRHYAELYATYFHHQAPDSSPPPGNRYRQDQRVHIATPA